MKNLSILLIFFACISCQKNEQSVSKQNVLREIKENDSMVSAAEKRLGKLTKIEKVFSDSKTGSTLRLVFAATSNVVLEDFFESNEIKFETVNTVEKEKLFSKTNSLKRTGFSQKLDEQMGKGFDDSNEVFFDLLKVSLSGNAVGYGFSIIKKAITENKKARISGISWCQQTSLEWCELATIYMNNTGGAYELSAQTRGLWWGNGQSFGSLAVANGSVYYVDVDGPKFTRFGGWDPIVSKFDHITWWDLESNSTVTG